MASPLVDDAPKDIKYIPKIIETDSWLELGGQRLETNAGGTPTRFKRREFGELVARIETEAQAEHESWVDNYYSYSRVPSNARALIRNNDAIISGSSIEGRLIFEKDVDIFYIRVGEEVVFHGNTAIGAAVMIGGGIAVGGGVAVASNASFSDVAVDSNDSFSGGLTIGGQMPTAHFYVLPAAWEPGDLTQDLEQLSWDECGQVLLSFTSYANELLKLKGIVITETRIRNWQAIDDTSWKQCILDLTVKAESHIALRIWDELTEELQNFINTQPEVIRPFLEDKLSLDVKWV